MDIEVISVEDENDDSDEEGSLEEIFSQEPHEEGHPPQNISENVTTDTVDLTGPAREPDDLSFEQEYDGLLSGTRGFGFPFETVAELLLRYSEHWWCRCVSGNKCRRIIKFVRSGGKRRVKTKEIRDTESGVGEMCSNKTGQRACAWLYWILMLCDLMPQQPPRRS